MLPTWPKQSGPKGAELRTFGPLCFGISLSFHPPMIRNLIFDFGNVLFDLDLAQIPLRFQRLWGAHYPAAMQRLQQHRTLERYETGQISTEEFVHTLRHAAPDPLSAEQVLELWDSIFLEMPASRFDLLLRLRQRYRVFLLSNINDLHARYITRYMLHRHGIQDFEDAYFDKVYYSHLIGLRKPERDVYEYVLADARLQAQECVFFDDMEANVAAARQVGIQGIHHRPGSDISARCADMGLLELG
ncbi:MAG TPA: HAD family phosphatase [Saprospiraceae bacterium]|nr:HAD family phosphatase [Saprospiraceae bacterium]HND88703.1 HAD family phosphatase [Saprospiraceae bacterium]